MANKLDTPAWWADFISEYIGCIQNWKEMLETCRVATTVRDIILPDLMLMRNSDKMLPIENLNALSNILDHFSEHEVLEPTARLTELAEEMRTTIDESLPRITIIHISPN